MTHRNLRHLILAGALAMMISGGPAGAVDTPSAPSPKKVTPADIRASVEAAYVYGYPLVLMGVTQEVMTNVASPADGRAPVNQFFHQRAFPTPEDQEVVRPNVDTLSSTAWLDLSPGPLVLHVPDTRKRYYVMQMLDGWTNVFAAVGKRSTGTGAGDFAIVGPGWKGKLPPGVQEIHAPTNLIWIMGRIQTNGPGDVAAVNALQNQLTLKPLGADGKAGTPPPPRPAEAEVDMQTPPREQVAKADAVTFFSTLAELLKSNPPSSLDEAILKECAAIGLAPGRKFDPSKLAPATAQDLSDAIKQALEKIAAQAKHLGKLENGWMVMSRKVGAYGADYVDRAAVALYSLGANLPADGIYPATKFDREGQLFSGIYRYRLHFAKGQTPPVNGFWSITLFDQEGFFVPNHLKRYALGDRDPLKFNGNGSLDIFIQHESPGKDREANWLPAPEGPFNLALRMYWPKDEVIAGTWKPPAVERVK
jgi:hypothetical protein